MMDLPITNHLRINKDAIDRRHISICDNAVFEVSNSTISFLRANPSTAGNAHACFLQCKADDSTGMFAPLHSRSNGFPA